MQGLTLPHANSLWELTFHYKTPSNIILNIQHENDLVFIKASKDLTYNDYIIFRKKLMDAYKELRENNKKNANSLELSEEIQDLLKNTINLCE